MNYLAHAFLSKNDKDLLIGNFIADHVRGNDFKRYPEKIVEGIRLHRKIDTFTDAHPEFKKSKRVFYQGFEKHSGILVDIYFDYFLARNFSGYSALSLDLFSENVYKVYSEHEHLLPESSSGFLKYVIKNNIYTSYSSLQGIQKVLFHLSHRINHAVKLDESVKLFVEHEAELLAYFNAFFKDAVSEFIPEAEFLR
jgi:acyl carrier protein phosphodiesterase